MATRDDTSKKRAVPIPAVVVAVVVLVALITGWGYHNFGPQDRGKSQVEVSTDDRMAKLAAQSGGDVSKLSEEDQKWLNNITMGHGATALQNARKH